MMATRTESTVAWEVVPAIGRLAFVGRIDGQAVGIVEWDGYGYRAVTCSGVILGTFDQVEKAQRALHERVLG